MPAEDESPLTMTPRQVARALQISEGTVCRMWKRGDLPRPVRVGGAIRFLRAEIMAFLEQHRAPIRDDPPPPNPSSR